MYPWSFFIETHRYTLICIHVCTHTKTYTQSCVQIHPHSSTNCTNTTAHIYSCMYAYIHTHACMHMSICTHTIHTHACTHPYTHIYMHILEHTVFVGNPTLATTHLSHLFLLKHLIFIFESLHYPILPCFLPPPLPKSQKRKVGNMVARGVLSGSYLQRRSEPSGRGGGRGALTPFLQTP